MVELNEDQYQLILGTLFGDAGCTLSKGGPSPQLEVAHRVEDVDYLRWKHLALLSSGLVSEDAVEPRNSQKPEKGWYFRTCSHPIITTFRDMFYENGRKRVSRTALHSLKPLGLAVWYMDDGCFSNRSPRVTLSTESFTYDENMEIRSWFLQSFGVRFEAYPKINRYGSPYYRLIISDKINTGIFMNIIRPYAVPCMGRKFG